LVTNQPANPYAPMPVSFCLFFSPVTTQTGGASNKN